MPAPPLVSLSNLPVCHGPSTAPWRWSQAWRDVLFCHWQVPSNRLDAHLPCGLALDLWEGSVWVSAVAFRLANVRLRGLPPFRPVSNLLELNLRTYVRHRGEPGIYFLSMHADNRLAIALARWLTPLPYALARIEYTQSSRHAPCAAALSPANFKRVAKFAALAKMTTDGTRGVPAALAPLFDARFEPRGICQPAKPNSLDAWLLERYRAFVPDRHGRLCRMVVEHPPWQVQDALLSASAPRLGDPWGLDLDRQPDAWHFSPGVLARVWPFSTVSAGCASMPTTF